MKKRMKQLTALALSVSMLAIAAGCGSQDVSTGSESNVSQETQATQATETTPTEVVVEELTYPLTTDVKLTLWDANTVALNEEYTEYSQSPFHTGLVDKTGVEIDWKWPVKGTNANEAFNLLLTEKELPDMIKRLWSASDGEDLINEGAIWDLTEYLPKYAPDYWEVINRPEYETSRRLFTTSSGKQFIMAAMPKEFATSTYIGPIVRKDWLDACGLDIPVTIADWEEMLAAFKEKYNVTPLAMAKTYLTSYVSPNLASATGAYVGLGATYAVEDGKIILANTTPEYKEYITMMNRWYTDGLLDKDSITMDNNAMRSKALNNQVGAAFVPMSQMTNFINDAAAEGTGAEWVAVGYPREAEGVATSMIQTNAAHWSSHGLAFSKSLSEEELIVALKWANYAYTEEGHMYWNFGEEGLAHTVDAAGNVAYTDLVMKDVNGVNSGLTKYTGNHTGGLGLQDHRILLLKSGEAGANAITVWTENTEGPSHKVPNLSFSPDDTLIHKNLWAQIQTYVAETCMKFLIGEESLDNWDAYVEKVKGMALEQDIAIYQKAYDEFIAK